MADIIPAKHIVMDCTPNFDYLAVEYSMNLYRGCNHGCIYCYARSDYYEKTDCFENLRIKEDALRIVRDDLLRKVRKGVVQTGSLTDPYNRLEKEHLLTRHGLELLNAFDYGACIFTKSDLVTRDIDVLSDINETAPTCVAFSITCAEDELSKKIEPGAATTTERFKAIEKIKESGIMTGVLMDPVLPYINDTEENVTEMVKKAKYYGADFIYFSPMVTMADRQRDYFLEELDQGFPGVSSLYRQRFGEYYRCRSPKSRKLLELFVETCEKEGISQNMRAVNQRMRRGYKEFALNLNHLGE